MLTEITNLPLLCLPPPKVSSNFQLGQVIMAWDADRARALEGMYVDLVGQGGSDNEEHDEGQVIELFDSSEDEDENEEMSDETGPCYSLLREDISTSVQVSAISRLWWCVEAIATVVQVVLAVVLAFVLLEVFVHKLFELFYWLWDISVAAVFTLWQTVFRVLAIFSMVFLAVPVGLDFIFSFIGREGAHVAHDDNNDREVHESIDTEDDKRSVSQEQLEPEADGDNIKDDDNNNVEKDEDLSARISRYLSPKYQAEKKAEESGNPSLAYVAPNDDNVADATEDNQDEIHNGSPLVQDVAASVANERN